MRVGIHLPQYGRAARPDAISEAARRAEALGFADIWVSDHVVAPAHHPLETANALATLDSLSAGRLTVAVGVGWSERELEALGQTFADRGARTDEILDIWRACWSDDPMSFHGTYYRFDDLRVLPHPAHPIPLWVGGQAEPAFRRAVTRGDGFHAIGLDPAGAARVVERIRRDRPDPAFPISLRTGWDPQGMDSRRIAEERDAYAAAGIQHVVAAPWRSDLAAWLRSMELLAEIVLR